MLTNIILISLAFIAVFFLLRPKIRSNHVWEATLTPLSSIIGSGFLVMAPILASIVGPLSPIAVTVIVIIAYSIGHIIRFNIRNIEPLIKAKKLKRLDRDIEYLSNVVLVFAYVIAVSFYIALLVDFLLAYLELSNPILEKILSTIIISFIAITGYKKGLGGLEKMESLSMTIQLSIVVALITGLSVYAISFFNGSEALVFDYQQRSIPVKIQMLAGALLIVQGFETSRFIGEKYSAEIRIKSMRYAQLLSGVLYIVSVILFMPLIQHINLIHVELSQIINITALAATVLPVMLIIAAIMSQFSAAVADISGAGGLLNENSRNMLSTNVSYIAVAIFAIVLIWTFDLFNIITLASKAFASYYLLQTLLALFYWYRKLKNNTLPSLLRGASYALLAIILIAIIIFSIPAE